MPFTQLPNPCDMSNPKCHEDDNALHPCQGQIANKSPHGNHNNDGENRRRDGHANGLDEADDDLEDTGDM